MAQVSQQEMLRHFATELQSGDAALFVGAGLSRAAGFVDWKGLLREIASDLKLDIDREADLVALAQYHVNERGGRATLNRLLIEEFTKQSELTENHRLIANLPIRTVWTTNYDDLLEAAFHAAHRRPDVKTTPENMSITIPQRDVVIYKMHGDRQQPHDAVLTKDDYETYNSRRQVFSAALQGDLVERTFLFLGFSFTDPNIDYILSRIRGLLGQNQRAHYCVMKWPDKPTRQNGAAQAEYEYQKRKLELRIADLSRYQIHAVMVDSHDEVTQILRELNRRAHLKHIFVSGSASSFEPLGRSQLEEFSMRLGRESIRRGFTLVSGFGLGIGAGVVMGGLEEIYRQGLPISHLSLFPFPQGNATPELRKAYRTSILSNCGIAVFVSGNRLDNISVGECSIAPGVLEEFRIATDLNRLVIPFGASGWAAEALWKQVSSSPQKYYGTRDVSSPLRMLGEPGHTNGEYVEAVFQLVSAMSQESQ